MTRSFPISIVLPCAVLALVAVSCSKEQANGIEASGIIETTDVTISARVAGPILRINVREGDHVRAGDTLFVIDDADLRVQRAGMLAGVDVARSQYDLVKNGARREDIGQAEEAMRQAKLTMENVADDQRRYAELLKVGSISEKDFVNVKTRLAVAERQYRAAALAVEKLRNGSRSEDVSTARARREQAATQVDAVDRRIKDCIAYAPIEGVVTRKAMEAGEFVNTGTGVLTVSRTDMVKLKIYVPENQLGRVKLGQKAELTIDTYNDRKYSGRVTYVSPTAEFTPKNVQTKDDRVKLVFEVQIEVPNPSGDLKSGMTADARLVDQSGR